MQRTVQVDGRDAGRYRARGRFGPGRMGDEREKQMRLLEGRGRVLALASCLLVLGLVAAPAASAAPGDFDSSFGSGGTAVSELNTGSTASTQVQDVIIDSAGRILVAGSTNASAGSNDVRRGAGPGAVRRTGGP